MHDPMGEETEAMGQLSLLMLAVAALIGIAAWLGIGWCCWFVWLHRDALMNLVRK